MLTITENFAVPLAFMKVKNSQQLNDELASYFHSLVQTNGYRNDIPTQPERNDIYESKFDLFEHDNKAVKYIKNLFHTELINLIMKLNDYPEAVRNTLEINQHAWFHITLKNGYFTNHNHPMASWSAIYCVASGGRPENIPESGITRFFHPNPNAHCYIDAGNANMKGKFANGSMNFPLEAGDLVFFPSYLMHEVSSHKGEQERITVAANFWIDSSLVKVRV